jgi:hypothetical protein
MIVAACFVVALAHAVWRQQHGDGHWNVWYRNNAAP